MPLLINDERTCRLATELGRLTGEKITDAIATALRERLDREQLARSSERQLREMRVISNRCAELLGVEVSSTELLDVLYDENGLPV